MTDKKPTPENEKESKDGESEGEDAREIGGYAAEGLPEPTRFGDWEVKGRCSDF